MTPLTCSPWSWRSLACAIALLASIVACGGTSESETAATVGSPTRTEVIVATAAPTPTPFSADATATPPPAEPTLTPPPADPTPTALPAAADPTPTPFTADPTPTALPAAAGGASAAVPLRVDGFGLEVVKMTLDCESGWLAPILTVDLADPAAVVDDVDQTIRFFGVDGPSGRMYETTDDVSQPLEEEAFGEFSAVGNPIDHPADYEAICAEPSWPVTLDLDDSLGNSLVVTVDAVVRTW